MSAFLTVISTRFSAVNHGLHVKDKRVRVLSVYYIFVGRLSSKILQHLNQIDNAYMSVKVLNNFW